MTPSKPLTKSLHERPLPNGWRWVKLGDVCELNPRRPVIERYDSEPTSFIPMESIDAISGNVSTLRERPFGEVKKGYTYFADNDVLFAKITPCMQNGKHAIAHGLIDGVGFGTTEFHVLRPGDGISSEWIHFFVRQPAFLHDATEHFTGSVGQQRLPQDYLARLEIPLPPLVEQQRIAGAINEQMAAVEKARAAAQARLAAVKALPAAFLRQIFLKPGQPLPGGWRWVQLGEVCEVTSSKRIFEAEYVSMGIPFYRTKEIVEQSRGHEIRLQLFISADRYKDIQNKYGIPTRGDILVSAVGTIGVSWIVPDDREFYFKDGNLLWLRNMRDVNPRFLKANLDYVFADSAKPMIDGSAYKALTIIKLKRLLVPLPPSPAQQRITEMLNEQMAAAEKARAAAEAELAAIEAMPAALLRRAFSGEL